ncbi:MAG: DUF4293 domain-containing protein, partial [Muribaculaceae bacterium]|nr:DUF4293 domain-containing protein [Muribaculaceae bacterium]
MVIQRWQSVLLLIAVIFMWVFCATPFAIDTLSNEVEFSIHAWDFTPFFLLNVAATIVLTVDIFLYRNLKRQIAVALVAIILLLCSIVYCGYLIFAVIPGGEIVWTGG